MNLASVVPTVDIVFSDRIVFINSSRFAAVFDIGPKQNLQRTLGITKAAFILTQSIADTHMSLKPTIGRLASER